jgi:hypothetical protein
MFQTTFGKEKRADSFKSRPDTIPLVNLMTQIVNEDDLDALNEFHNNRTIFQYAQHKPLRFVEFLNCLRENTAKMHWLSTHGTEVADEAFNLTIDKFTHLPAQPIRDSKLALKRNGPDCRLYFGACLKKINHTFSEKPPGGQIEEEIKAAKLLQRFVRFHFYLSRLEAERHSNRFWSRYNWKVKESRICLYLPVSLRGHKRGEWLEMNIDNPDPSRPNEKNRIQEIINRKLVKERFVPLCEAVYVPGNNAPSYWDQSKESLQQSLATVVAQEKADNIKNQRLSIRKLGRKRLKSLIMRVFEDMDCDQYEDGKIARDFDLSKSTFSRFAGSRWEVATESPIPDLWRNVAGVLSTHPVFREIAMETGYLEKVKAALKADAAVHERN